MLCFVSLAYLSLSLSPYSTSKLDKLEDEVLLAEEGSKRLYDTTLRPILTEVTGLASNQTGPLRSSHQPESTADPTVPNSSKHRSPGFHRKDTVHNVESTGYFCWQLATYPLRHAVNASAESLPYDIDEFDKANLEKEWSQILPIRIPMVRESPVKFECQYVSPSPLLPFSHSNVSVYI